MIAARASALALVAVLGVTAAARAEPPPPPAGPGAMGGATWAPGSQVRHEMRETARLKALHDALNIRPDQESAFQAFAASMRPGDRGPGPEGMEHRSPDTAGMTTPERLDAMARMMDEHMARMRDRFQRHATAVKALYAVLNPEQRRTLDALPDLVGHGMGMGMAMGRHGDMGKPGMDHPVEHE
jgi:hypothetical protein